MGELSSKVEAVLREKAQPREVVRFGDAPAWRVGDLGTVSLKGSGDAATLEWSSSGPAASQPVSVSDESGLREVVGQAVVELEAKGASKSTAAAVVAGATTALGLVGYVYALGGLVSWFRLAAARLPADLISSLLDPRILLVVGLRVVLVVAAILAAVSLVAYGLSSFPLGKTKRVWSGANKKAWTDNTRELDGAGKFSDHIVATVAGINVLAIAAVLGLTLASAVEAVFDRAEFIWVFVALWALATAGLVAVSAKLVNERIHFVVAVVAGGLALFLQPGLALLLVSAVVTAAFGRAILKTRWTRTVGTFVRSPLPWALAVVYAVVGLAFYATPPVSFPRATVATTAGQRVGGLVAHTGDGVYLATCSPTPGNFSREERVALIRSDDVKELTIGGDSYLLDSGKRPSVVGLVQQAFGAEKGIGPFVKVKLRSERPVCDASERAGGGADEGLGRGVMTGPAPTEGKSTKDEPLVADRTPPTLAKLALKYQPTVLTTVADRFWPTSVASVLAEVGADGKGVCLSEGTPCSLHRPTLGDLTPSGKADHYLDLPERLKGDPTAQFLAFTRGQSLGDDLALNWLNAPAALKVWRTARVYFYYGGPVEHPELYRTDSKDLIALQYWFFYPYNYYPTVVNRHLMLAQPIAGDRVNTDLHEGDWEHVVVLLDKQRPHDPRFLYTARHDKEGELFFWGDVDFDEQTHPVVQAAFGGHPTYPAGCEQQPRRLLKKQSSDWLVCATGRYAFRASVVPLVDLGLAPWSCWPGHFGEATAKQRKNAALPEYRPERWHSKLVQVAGPRSPLYQRGNEETCTRGAAASEKGFR
ncbi:MAG: hypothetical protein QOK00_964 [Thermoleophilaceae bacterium]|nr:hypothetical protein [Thermoleophilaceae bacterium]